ncbi:MAG: hypothetical protein ACOYKE_09005 [Ferruginibacter sp.]
MKSLFIKTIALFVFAQLFQLSIFGRQSTVSLGSTVNDTIIKTKTYEVKLTAITVKNIETYWDSTYFPRSLYFNIRFKEIQGINIDSLKNTSLFVQLLNVKKDTIVLEKSPKRYIAKTYKAGDQINMLISIPLKPTDPLNKKYSYVLIIENMLGKKYINMNGKTIVK